MSRVTGSLGLNITGGLFYLASFVLLLRAAVLRAPLGEAVEIAGFMVGIGVLIGRIRSGKESPLIGLSSCYALSQAIVITATCPDLLFSFGFSMAWIVALSATVTFVHHHMKIRFYVRNASIVEARLLDIEEKPEICLVTAEYQVIHQNRRPFSVWMASDYEKKVKKEETSLKSTPRCLAIRKKFDLPLGDYSCEQLIDLYVMEYEPMRAITVQHANQMMKAKREAVCTLLAFAILLVALGFLGIVMPVSAFRDLKETCPWFNLFGYISAIAVVFVGVCLDDHIRRFDPEDAEIVDERQIDESLV